MADTLYPWARFGSWVATVSSASYQLQHGTTWTPSSTYTQTDVSDVRTFTLSSPTQTKVSGGRIYTATFSHWTFSYSGTYPDWESYISTSGPSVSINHSTEYRTIQSPYSSGVARCVANWTITSEPEPQLLSVSTASDPLAGGTTTGDGQYASGATCTVVATPANGYEFVRWVLSTGDTSKNASYSFTVTQDTTATAYFRQYTGLPLYGSSGTILCNASGSILCDS